MTRLFSAAKPVLTHLLSHVQTMFPSSVPYGIWLDSRTCVHMLNSFFAKEKHDRHETPCPSKMDYVALCNLLVMYGHQNQRGSPIRMRVHVQWRCDHQEAGGSVEAEICCVSGETCFSMLYRQWCSHSVNGPVWFRSKIIATTAALCGCL